MIFILLEVLHLIRLMGLYQFRRHEPLALLVGTEGLVCLRDPNYLLHFERLPDPAAQIAPNLFCKPDHWDGNNEHSLKAG